MADHVVTDPAGALELFSLCPEAAPTPLLEPGALAAALGVGRLYVKDERRRMGLGSFKALGATHAIARLAVERAGKGAAVGALDGEVFVCASAGNHGLSVAAGARIFGAESVVFISDLVPEEFAGRLRRRGAMVVRAGSDYEQSMAAAEAAAGENGWHLLSDSTWPGYFEPARRVMEGYLIMGAEVVDTIDRPTHIMLQAGVGGLAASLAGLFRSTWGDAPAITVVEPESAACLMESALAGRPVVAPGPPSDMGRLDCKEASHLALARLTIDADYFVTIADDECAETVELLEQHELATTSSGAAGLAAIKHAGDEVGLDGTSTVLCFITEGRGERPI